jgi:Ca2+-binding EF-hand superfamily protein
MTGRRVRVTLRAAVGRLSLVGLVLSVAGCGGSNPLDTFKSGPSTFDVTFISAAETWDIDKNGIVTCDEWKQYASTSLQQADGNADGALTTAEFTTMSQSDKLFDIATHKYYDRNSDGQVTAEELTTHSNRAFELLDKNKDCKIERGEKVQVRYKQKAKPSNDETKTIDPTGTRR